MSNDSEDNPQVYEPQTHESEDDGFDELHSAYKATLRRIDRLPEINMHVAILGEALAERSAEEAAWWIDQLMRGALWGRTPDIDAMMACSMWLIRQRLDDNYELIKSIFTAAHEDDRKAVIAILRDPPAFKALPEGKRLKEPDLQINRDVTVGEKRQMARGNNRQMIERLLLDPNPLVIEQLLNNPSVREQDVLMVSTKRPNTPEILLKVALHRRWFNRREVRYSVVMNPYNATGLSLKLLPTLGIQKLRKVRNSTNLHETILEAAKMLVDLREERTAPWRV